MEIRRVQSKEGPRQMGTLGCALVRTGGYRLSVAEGEMGFHNGGVGDVVLVIIPAEEGRRGWVDKTH